MNKNSLNRILMLLFISSGFLICQSCRKDRYESEDNLIDYTKYFPISEGMYHIYEAKKIVFDPFNNKSDTLFQTIKNIQDTFFLDNLQRTAMRFYRMLKKTGERDWDSTNAFYAIVNKSHAEVFFENKRFVKLSFPIHNENFWDVNIYNIDSRLMVAYNKLLDTFSLNNLNFTNCVEVRRLAGVIPFEELFWQEIYCKDIGLIQREYINVETLNNRTKGIIETYNLIEYGYE